MESCLHEAARPPFGILKLSSRVVELDERLAEIGSKLAISDAATSVMLAHGAMYGAYMNVIVNTRLMKDRPYAEMVEQEAGEILDRYSVKALEVYHAVLRRLNNG